jgi:hypothetical protein
MWGKVEGRNCHSKRGFHSIFWGWTRWYQWGGWTQLVVDLELLNNTYKNKLTMWMWKVWEIDRVFWIWFIWCKDFPHIDLWECHMKITILLDGTHNSIIPKEDISKKKVENM